MSEESPIQMLERQVTRIKEEEAKDDTELHLYQMRRTWERRLGVFKHIVPSDNGCVFCAANFSMFSTDSLRSLHNVGAYNEDVHVIINRNL